MRFKDENGLGLFQYERIRQLDIEINNTCNAKCSGCERTNNPNIETCGNRFISLNEIKKFFPPEFLKQIKFVFICGGYGEPTMHPDFLDIVRYFIKYTKTGKVGFSTNGGARTAKWWAELGSIMQHRQANFSIDGLGDTNHLYKKGVKWDKLVRNIKAYMGAGGTAKWQMIITEINEHQIEETKEFAKQLGFKYFVEKTSFRTKHNKLFTDENPDIPKLSEKKEKKHPYREQIEKIFDNPDLYKKWYKDAKVQTCQNVNTPRIFVSFDGKVWPCNWMGCIEYFRNPEPHFPLPQHKMYNYPLDFNSLYNVIDKENPVKEILKHPFFTHTLEDSFTSADTAPRVCKEMCHTKLGFGKFESMRRNQQDLKTGEYLDLNEIHGLLGEGKKYNGTGIGSGSNIIIKPTDDFMDINK